MQMYLGLHCFIFLPRNQFVLSTVFVILSNGDTLRGYSLNVGDKNENNRTGCVIQTINKPILPVLLKGTCQESFTARGRNRERPVYKAEPGRKKPPP